MSSSVSGNGSAQGNGSAPGNGPAPGENGSPFHNAAALFASLWRLLRGQDQRGRKVRWLIGLLRPYRGRMGLMFVFLVACERV